MEPTVGEVVAGRYEIEELVANGGMASVFKASDRSLERHVALKVLQPRFGEDHEHVARFRREARAVAQLSHPNIVTVIDRGEADGHQFIVFEFVDGENLKELIERNRPAADAARGRARARGRRRARVRARERLVHRDVKPQNVLLTRDGHAKVTDFGIARSLDVEHGVTQTGTVLGTSNYLSPEQASGKPTTPSTDVYSLGVVLYELLTGEVPFPGDNFVAVAMKHINEPPPSVLDVRPDLIPRLVAAVEQRARERSRRTASRRWTRSPPSCGSVSTTSARLRSRPHVDSVGPIVRPRPSRRQRRSVPLAVDARSGSRCGRSSSAYSHSAARRAVTAARAEAALPSPVHGIGNLRPPGGDDDACNDTASLSDGRQSVDVLEDAALRQRRVRRAQAWRRPRARRGLVRRAEDADGDQRHTRLHGEDPGGRLRAAALHRRLARRRPVNAPTTFTLHGHERRYYVVWITDLGAQRTVHVNEVRATR